MLTVYTDIEETSWLQYILEEFCRIQDAQFTFIITGDTSLINENTLVYANDLDCDIQPKMPMPNGTIKFVNEALFILPESSGKGKISFDLFWNAFVFLSRLEEYNLPCPTQSYSKNHPRKEKDTFNVPIVNLLFSELEEYLSSKDSSLQFGKGDPFEVYLSHDLDYTRKTIQLRLKQTAFNAFNALRSVSKPRLFVKRTGKTFRFLFSSPSYWCFDYWVDLEKSYNATSTFYVFAKGPQRGFKSWLIDPSYNVSKDKELQKTLRALHSAGFEIGLHGSFHSFGNKELLEREKAILEKAIDLEITATRQHWLRYDDKITPNLHEDLFNTDSTLGWNDRMGLRSGCCSLYRPYNHAEKAPYDYFEIPQVIMDSNLYDYNPDDPITGIEEGKKLLQTVRNYKNAHVSISWHPRTCSSDYNWHIAYEELLKTIYS